MDVRQLAAIVAIADHGTFSAAARSLFTVQSNVSGHVSRLEKELGVKVEEGKSVEDAIKEDVQEKVLKELFKLMK